MKEILTLVPGGIGDQLLFFPTLEQLKHHYPNSQLSVVVEPRAKGAYRANKYFHDGSLNLIPFDFKDRNGPADWGNLMGIVRDREYDAVLSLGRRWTVGLLLWLTGIPRRVGYGEPGSLFLTHPVPLKPEQYAAEMYHDLVRGLGIQSPCPPMEVTLLKEDVEWSEQQQAELGVTESGYVLVHGGASQLAQQKGLDKIYPVENWVKVLQGMQQRQPNLPIVAVCGPDDGAFIRELTEAVPGLKTISPPDIGKLAATIAAANVMLCTDSAPMHLAVAVQTYTYALFGPTDAKKLLPRGDRAQGIVSATGKMADIDPQSILDKVFS
ncbi:MAG: lipopolysaccharide heptosyltransferase family protein [Phormidium sp. SL48-SHIP]|nr:MAG: lipopolysaccharide heptosyltransferase family protein [Phormidium sp. SL48-SHIP]